MSHLHDPGPEVEPGHVLEAKTGGYLVLSRSTVGVWYLVHGASCSCEAGRRGVRCWHRSQVGQFVAALNREQARPVAPPHIAALVD
jgi:hypothetical protein